ncbi:respiratory chain complex I subunit 1 family protein [Salinisphaera hydrothermalis]|uniref:respiratory chain complex I subunit 1 family protein n=1 Tax=Salinisphaera hydrothermalis TaxID=563188 RepID=UPI00334021F5
MSLPDVVSQIGQVLAALLLSPLLEGFILRGKERVQRATGPALIQPYRDLWKLFHKELVVPESASFVYLITPIVAFAAMCIVPMLIPVLTDFPLPQSDMGDILGGGMVLSIGSFMLMMSGLDTGSAYGGIGSSRSAMLGILSEPTLILVLAGVALLAHTMLPFPVNHLLAGHWPVFFSPAHIFIVCAFFVLLLVETDRLPIHSSTDIEIYMIGAARTLEYSGPLMAFVRWASMMKQFILYTIFCNVLTLPWGLSHLGTLLGAVGAVGAIAIKFGLVALAVIVVETAQARLRFFRYQEPLAASFLLAVLGIVAQQF